MYRHRRKRRQHPGRTSGLLAAVGNKGAAAVAWPPARPAFGALAEICAPEKDQLDFTRALSVISEPAEARFEDMPSRDRRCRKRTLAISHWPRTAKLWDGGTPRLLQSGLLLNSFEKTKCSQGINSIPASAASQKWDLGSAWEAP